MIVKTDQNLAFADEVTFLHVVGINAARNADADRDIAVAGHDVSGAREYRT